MDPSTMHPTIDALAAHMLVAIEASSRDGLHPWIEEDFDELAVALFRAQAEEVPAYGAWCDATAIDVDAVTSWRSIPALPVEVFRRQRVAAHDATADVATWHSSTTTGDTPSIHHLQSLDVYEVCVRAGARAALVPDIAATELTAVQLVPSGEELPHGSLPHMLDLVRTELCAGGTVPAHVGTDGNWRVDAAAAWDSLNAAASDGAPVLVLATSFSLVQLLDDCTDRPALMLPRASRVMDTGGYKGRARELTRSSLAARIEERLGINESMIENEFGMCELSSQSYLGTIAHATGHDLPGWSSRQTRLGGRWSVPWLRTRIVDPVTLNDVDDGEVGLVVHHDLANAYSCACIRTEDLGLRIGDTWSYVGRATESVLRGCSLPAEDLSD